MVRKYDQAKYDAILKSARILYRDKGVKGTTIAEIASSAGIATGTVYLYFKSKSDIMDALCEFYLTDHIRKIAPQLENADIHTAIANAVHTALEHSASNADLVRLVDLRRSMNGKTSRLEADRTIQRTLRAWVELHAGKGDLVQYNPAILVELISGMVEWISKICFVWTNIDPLRYEDTLIDLLDHALINKSTNSNCSTGSTA